MPAEGMLTVENDRYGGVVIEIPETAIGRSVADFGAMLATQVQGWRQAGKRGVWLTVPSKCADFVGQAVKVGFEFHHAKPGYVQLTMWLPSTPSPLPRYGFTQIGVGGVVVNTKGEVLMVQEKTTPLPRWQGSWKLPGGLADPGENFADTVAREVFEETKVTGKLVGVVSLRHTHDYRFGQGDMYVLVKLLAENDEISMDDGELAAAEWMSQDRIKSLIQSDPEASLDGKVSPNNWTMIDNALNGKLIDGAEMRSSRSSKPSMLYTAGL